MNRSTTRGILALTFFVGCIDPPPRVEPKILRVAAASELFEAASKIVAEFEKRSKGTIKVVVTHRDSKGLADQIRSGTSFDLFLSTDMSTIDALVKDGLIEADSARRFAFGVLVIARSPDATGEITSIAELDRPEIKKIAIADPAQTRSGAAATEALKSSGVFERIEPKLVRAETTRGTLALMQTGSADFAFVDESIAAAAGLEFVIVDPKSYRPIEYGLGVLKRSRNADRGRALASFITSEEGETILAKSGFSRASGSTH